MLLCHGAPERRMLRGYPSKAPASKRYGGASDEGLYEKERAERRDESGFPDSCGVWCRKRVQKMACDMRFPVQLWGYHGFDLQAKLFRVLKKDRRKEGLVVDGFHSICTKANVVPANTKLYS